MPCHAATASAGDVVTRLALLAFVLGGLARASVWISGARRAPRHEPGIRGRLRAALASFLLDGLLQRRLLRHSRGRWVLHALVFFPFLFRFLWGLAALAGSRLSPEAGWVWVLLDQNHPLTALLFDASGLAVLTGAAAMIVRRLAAPRLPGLPPADWPAHALLAALMASGFVLEGARIALAGHPPGAAFAFVGDGLARIFHGAAGLDALYPVIWYAHAIVTGAFVAYLPFSRMRHVLLAPIALALRPLAAREATHA
jgi:nitrate reductase gamma subunit